MSFQDSYRLALEKVAAGDVTPIMLWPIGTFKSAKYPNLSLTRELADEVIANFAGGILGTEPVVDSSGRHDTSAPAAGWVKRVYVAPMASGGEAAFADVQWTEVGAQKVNGREYQYNSVELGPVIDNVTGEKTDNVLRSVTLTNTPVIRLLPRILAAGDAIAEPVTVALSEITVAEDEDPMASLLADLEAVISKADETLRGKPGVRAIRTYLREVRAKASAHSMTEDPGDPAASDSASSEPDSQDAKGDEGHSTTLADGSAEPKEGDHMKTVALKLKLAEDATEEVILAEVTRLEESRDAEKLRADEATASLAEVKKAKRAGEVEVVLAELISGGHVAPGQKGTWLALAEAAPEQFDAMAEAAKQHKVIDLGEHGASGGNEGSAYANPSVELAEKAKARAAKDGLKYAAAEKLVLAEDPDLKTRYFDYRVNPGKEA